MNSRMLLPLLSLSLFACTDIKGGEEIVGSVGFEDIELEQSTVVPTVFAVRWQTTEPVESFVRFGEVGGAMIFETPVLDVASEHEGIMVGVPEVSEGWFELVGVKDGVESTSSRYEFSTGQLSADIPRPRTVLGDSSRATPGLILAPIALDMKRWTTLMDHHGRMVWAWGGDHLDTQRARMTQDGKGVIMMDRIQNSKDIELVRVDFFGDEVWRITLADSHHDFALITDESFLVMGYDVREAQLSSGPRLIMGDQIFQYGLDGSRSTLWSVWDHVEVDEASLGGESMEVPGSLGWSHGNYLYLDRDKDQVLTTMRDINMAFAIDRQNGEVLWSMGGQQGEFQAPNPTPILKYPHSVWPTETGFTVFNQGIIQESDCSWAAHIELDEATLSAKETWSYSSPTCYQTYYLGNAQPLIEDRTLVSFGKVGVLDEISTGTGETIVRHSLDIPAEFLYVEHIGGVYPANP